VAADTGPQPEVLKEAFRTTKEKPMTGVQDPVTTGIAALDPAITQLDLRFLDVERVIAAYLVDAGDELVLIETGPTTTLANLERAIEETGRTLGDVTRIVVTHIHLDHSGAAGVIVRKHPHIRVAVHPVGAPHLVDPERLVRSAGRIYGDDMDRLWGEIVGVPEGQVDVLEDDGVLTYGDRRFRVAYTAGHAGHHIALFDEQGGTLFTGDTGGVRMPGTTYVGAPIPPPELDPDAWRVSLARMRAFQPARLALTHFGIYDDVDAHLAQIEPRLDELVALGEAAGESLADTEDMARRLDAFQRAHLGADATDANIRQLNLANPDILGAMGLQRYLRKRREAAS
jgi:glyoxylase-like metal-dependent hydrolase (beta-lactamase superfamily II)